MYEQKPFLAQNLASNEISELKSLSCTSSSAMSDMAVECDVNEVKVDRFNWFTGHPKVRKNDS